jgi:precorrin-4 methylase
MSINPADPVAAHINILQTVVDQLKAARERYKPDTSVIYVVHAVYEDNEQLYVSFCEFPERVDHTVVLKKMWAEIVKSNGWELDDEESYAENTKVRWLSVIHFENYKPVFDWTDSYYVD